MNAKLLVIYRVCPKETSNPYKSCRPNYFNKKKCFKSFWDAFNNKPDTEINIIFDGDIDCDLYRYINQFTNKIVNVTFCDDTSTLIFCHNFALGKEFDYVYFLEDDFLHLPGSYERLIDGLKLIKDNGFVSLYDHLDRYFRDDDITFGQERIVLGRTGYWRTAESTTNTVAMSRKVLMQTSQDKTFCGNRDRMFFVDCLQKHELRLITPIPAKSTHVNKFFYSPYIDWEEVNSKIIL